MQESLTNIGKYAQAHNVTISLQNFNSYVNVEVKDDGKGFDPAESRLSSHGLAGMRHRVEAGGGHLTVTSRPGNGTCISAVVPKNTGAS